MSRLPQLTSRELLSFLKAQGFIEDRQKGSHLTLKNTESGRTVTIPMHTTCDIGRGLAQRLLKDAGFSIEDYLKLR